MLQPSENFTAAEIQFLQNESADFIKKVNQQIIEAWQKGENSVSVRKYEENGGGYLEWTKFQDAIIAHFKSRGFNVTQNGQTSIIIDWKTEIKK